MIINNQNKQRNSLNADGLVTNLTGIGLSILGADCAPILFYDDKSKTIGACHAGWRGAINNIIESNLVSTCLGVKAIISNSIFDKGLERVVAATATNGARKFITI